MDKTPDIKNEDRPPKVMSEMGCGCYSQEFPNSGGLVGYYKCDYHSMIADQEMAELQKRRRAFFEGIEQQPERKEP